MSFDDKEPESLMEYIERGIKANRGTGSPIDHGKVIAAEAIMYQLKKAVEKIEYIRLADINCDADGMRDKILEILQGKQSTQES